MEERDTVSCDVRFPNLACTVVLDKEVRAVIGDSSTCFQWPVAICEISFVIYIL